jgi:D-alanyl-D-alanine carboxypeptidase
MLLVLRNGFKKLLLGLGAALLVPVGAAATVSADFADRATVLLAETYPDDGPGAAIIVSRKGEVLYRGARGMADLELGVPLSTDNVFRIASVTKQYTAVAVLALAEEGKLRLEDPIGRFLPDYPTPDVTIHQLLNHTSGIRNYTGIPEYFASFVRQDVTTSELIAFFAAEEPVSKPGETWAYNNSGYVLLAAIIEKVTGKSWEEYLAERFFRPRGLNRTGAFPDSMILPGRAGGYQYLEGKWINAPFVSVTQPHAAGAILSTIDELDRWQQALHRGELLSQAMYQRMTTPVPPAAGFSGDPYGYGLFVGDLRGRQILYHDGGIPGFAAYASWQPEESLSVVILANHNNPSVGPRHLGPRLAALALGDPYPLDRPRADLTPDQLRNLQGSYRTEDGSVRILRLDGNRLVTSLDAKREFPLKAVAGGLLAFETSLSHLEIEHGPDGRVSALIFYQDGRGEGERAVRI